MEALRSPDSDMITVTTDYGITVAAWLNEDGRLRVSVRDEE